MPLTTTTTPHAAPAAAPPPAVVRSELHGVAGVSRVLPGYVAGLGRDVARLLRPLTPTTRPDVRRAAHQLRGSGGSYGFPDLTRLAVIVESAIDRAEPDAVVSAAVAELVAHIRRIEGYDRTAEFGNAVAT